MDSGNVHSKICIEQRTNSTKFLVNVVLFVADVILVSTFVDAAVDDLSTVNHFKLHSLNTK